MRYDERVKSRKQRTIVWSLVLSGIALITADGLIVILIGPSGEDLLGFLPLLLIIFLLGFILLLSALIPSLVFVLGNKRNHSCK